MPAFLQLALLLGTRMLWQRRPNRWTCGLFWAIALGSQVIGWSFAPSQIMVAVGILSNAAVTLANGGFMPVAGHRRVNMRARSLWVQREGSQHLLFLADNFGTNFIRFSVGDVFILVGIVLSFFGL
jgi:hypothetical protein